MSSPGESPLESAPWPVLMLDEVGGILASNPAACELLGEPAAPPPSLVPSWASANANTLEQFLAAAELTPTSAVEVKLNLPHGLVAFTAAACAMRTNNGCQVLLQLLPLHGIAGQKPSSSETGIWHKQKLDCALQLARTVALDFNNALTSILGHTSLVLSQMEPSHPWRNSLSEVEKSAAKAAEIAIDLGTFSHQEKEVRTAATGNLNQVLQRSVEFLQQNGAPASIRWNLQLERRLFGARFEDAKMQQAFIKVLENAVQAIGESGWIGVQTRNVELTEATQDRNVRLKAGAYVCAEVSDNGCGIEGGVLPRIFEPFFTTKRDPKHRGLGLAWVYGIVTNHGGRIAVSSEPKAGTSVRIYLPAVKEVVRENKVVAPEDLAGNQRILIVDDEDLLLTVGQTILSTYGYKVETANSGPKALEILQRESIPVDLMVTDLVMPGMSGQELVEQAQRIAPQTRILCTSGYVRSGTWSDERTYLQKPFSSQELLMKIKELLSSGS